MWSWTVRVLEWTNLGVIAKVPMSKKRKISSFLSLLFLDLFVKTNLFLFLPKLTNFYVAFIL